jgi:hypothetical protein
MFKVLGIFLLPSAVKYFFDRPGRELVIATFTATVIALPLILYFDLAFITRMLTRLRDGGTPVPTPGVLHASPWSLIPDTWVFYARPLVCSTLAGLTIAAFVTGRINLLNCSAAICLVFTCLWLLGGSMDRMNIAMMFALTCTATMSVKSWQILTVANFLVQVPIYIAVFRHHQYALGLDPELPDAVATMIFIVFYFTMVFLRLRESSAHDPVEDRGVARSSG